MNSDNKNLSEEKQIPILAHYPERFDIETQKEEMLSYLKSNGYVVIKRVADTEKISTAKSEFWKWSTNLSKELKKDDPETWDKHWVGNKYNGICHFINHSNFAWNTRLLPKVKETFATIWGDDDLIVSFDAGNAFRPWKYNRKWLTAGGWWHVDQNDTTGKHKKNGMVCVQGLVTYYDATEETGGLCLIPKSHVEFSNVCKRASSSKLGVDFVALSSNEEPLLQTGSAYLICAKAGDLILWDSRTIHCNTPSIVDFKEIYNEKLVDKYEIIRLVSYVCMVPYSHASKRVIESRKEGFRLKKPTSHWPTEEITTTYTCDDQPFNIDNCSDDMLSLVGFKKRNFCSIF